MIESAPEAQCVLDLAHTPARIAIVLWAALCLASLRIRTFWSP